MGKRNIILLYLFVIIAVRVTYPSISYPYSPPIETISQYIVDLSKDISHSIQQPDEIVIQNSRGEIRLRLLLSPWGELKDAYIFESSGNKELDNLSLKAVWLRKRYQPFPDELGEDNLWIDVPIIFAVDTIIPSISMDIPQARPERPARREAKASSMTPINVGGIGEAVDIALENHMALEIAGEEIDLSKLKIREARRALYPTASLDYLETTGKTTGQAEDFTDKEYKLKFEYPLYYGWRLKYAVSQAISNMKASMYNYDKTLQDLRVEVETAFYSYLISKANVRLQKALLDEAGRIFSIAKKRYDLELSTRAEFLQIESQLKQINYQIASSENEAAIARLTLGQAMNIAEPEDLDNRIDNIEIEIDVMNIEPLDIDITLEESLDLAFKYRPDLKGKGHMVEFNDYALKVEDSKSQFKVDLTGAYGRSGGAFETEESLELETDWFLGIKVSKPLGGNTLSTGYTEEKTSQRHGESTRTESISKSIGLGLLDNLQSFSEKKSSEISLKKAKDELKQTREAIIKEVKEAYLNYKKGLIQVKSNLNKVRYREEELKITKARAELDEISFSDLLQAHMGLTDEKSFYIETVGSLYQSLVRLNKATGYALFLDSESFMLANVE